MISSERAMQLAYDLERSLSGMPDGTRLKLAEVREHVDAPLDSRDMKRVLGIWLRSEACTWTRKSTYIGGKMVQGFTRDSHE